MPTISSLVVELKLQADNFNSAIKAAQKEAKELEKVVKPTKEALQDLGTVMTAAGGAIVAGMLAATKATADYADHVNDLSKMTGASTENLSKWGFAAEQSGSSLDGVSLGLKLLAKNMELASAGGKAQIAAFNAAGISSRDLADAHGDVNRILPRLADSFHNAEDSSGKTAVALALLGKSGSELIPMLNEGSAGLEHWGEVAQNAGRVVSAEAGAAADEFNDKLGILEGSLAGVAGVIGVTLMPVLSEFIVQATGVVQQVLEWTAAHPELIKAVGAAAAVLAGSGGLLLGMAGVLAILPKLQTAWALLTGAVSLSTLGLGAVLAAIVYFRKEIAEGLLAALATAVKGMEDFTDWAARMAEKVGLQGLADKLHDASFSAGTFRRELDTSVASLMAEGMTIDKTAGQLKAEEAARKSNTDAIVKHTITLQDNDAAMKAQKKSYDDFVKVWTDAYLVINKNTEAMKVFAENSPKMHAAYQDAVLDSNNLQNAQINLAGHLNTTAQAANIKFLLTVDPQTQANIDAQTAAIKKAAEDDKRALQDAINSVKDSAGHIFDDMFITGQNVFGSIVNLLKGGMLSLGRAIFEDVAGALMGPIKKAFDDFFTGLLESTGINAFVDGLGKKLGKMLSDVLGGSGPAGTAAGGAGSVAGGAGGGGGESGAGGAAGGAGGLLGTLSSLANIAGAIGSIAGAIGTFRLEGTMNAVEANTRFTYIELRDLIDQIMWPIFGFTQTLYTNNGIIINQLDAIWVSLEGIRTSGSIGVAPSTTSVPVIIPTGGGGAGSINGSPTGAGGTGQAPIVLQPTVTIHATVNTTGGAQAAQDFLGELEQNGDARRAFRDMFGRPI